MSNLKILIPALLISLSFAGCELIGDIFEFGVWVGVILVIVVILIIVWLFRLIF